MGGQTLKQSFILPSISPTQRSHQVITAIHSQSVEIPGRKDTEGFHSFDKYALLYSFSYLRLPSPTQIVQTVDAGGRKVRKQIPNLQSKNL